MNHRNLIAGAIVVCALLATACDSPEIPAPAKEFNPVIPYSHIWSADPGIDVLSREAELIRATFEADWYAEYVGVNNSYPGYSKAVSASASQTGEKKQEEFTSEAPIEFEEPIHQTTYNHITNFSTATARVTAAICTYNIPVKPRESALTLTGYTRVELTNTGTSVGIPSIPDKNPATHDTKGHNFPQWNVFDTWKITEINYEKIEKPPSGCFDWWQKQFPMYIRYPTAKELFPPPGYQYPHHPVAVQYPEWIGPAKPS